MSRHTAYALVLPLTVVLSLAVLVPRAGAITFGEVDYDNAYPNVGCLAWEVPSLGRNANSSGTLVTPSLFLTAAHMTRWLENFWGQYPDARQFYYVSFAPNAFDRSDPTTWRRVAGVVTHPSYRGETGKLQTAPCDVGLVILEEPFGNEVPVTPLPPLACLDELKRQGAFQTSHGDRAQFRVVGYGSMLNWPPPTDIEVDGWRRFADSTFLNVLQGWLLCRQNPAAGDGGTGYGDSGGPVFWTGLDGTQQVLVGETTWGDPNLVAMNFYQRLDLPEVQDFVYAVIDSLP